MSEIEKRFLVYLELVKGHKACKNLREFVEGKIAEIQGAGSQEFDADLHADIFKLAVESNDPKIMLETLIIIEDCIAFGAIDGTGLDIGSYVNIANANSNVEKMPEKKDNWTLIDGLVQAVCYCYISPSEDVVFKMCKVILSICTDLNQELGKESLKTIFKTLCSVLETKAFDKAQLAAKKTIFYIAYNLMQNLEIVVNFNKEIEEETNAKISSTDDNFVHNSIMSYLVDCTAAYIERESKIQDPSKTPPIFLAPQNFDNSGIEYTNLEPIEAVNEEDQPAGKFGWCAISRKPADLYCKESRLPIHSLKEKILFIEKENACEKKFKENVEREGKARQRIIENTLIIFTSIMKFAFAEEREDKPENTKLKQYFLDILHNLLQSPSKGLIENIQFIEFLRGTVLRQLIKSTTISTLPIFSNSISIFYFLIKHFRHHFIEEISIFVLELIIPMLESVNNKYAYKSLLLKILRNIVQEPMICLDFFVNYDCNIYRKNVLEKIIFTITKIAKGMFKRSEYAITISQDEETEMANLATSCLVKMTNSLDNYVHQEMKKGHFPIFQDGEYSNLSPQEEKVFARIKSINSVRSRKADELEAIDKFNVKIKLGIKRLIELGFIEEGNAESYADFLHKHVTKLSNTKLGEFFGDEDAFNGEVLYKFIEKYNFEGYKLTDAMRTIFRTFDMPGESQKIERIVYKIGEKYSEDNPESIDSDASGVLAYSIVMLHTNLNSRQVQASMKFSSDAFYHMAKVIPVKRGILNEEYIREIYDDVVKKPIAQHTAEIWKEFKEEARNSNMKKKEQSYQIETNLYVDNAYALLEITSPKSLKDYEFGIHVSYIRPFLEAQWTQLFAFFSILIGGVNDLKRLNELNENSKIMIKLADFFHMYSERDAFIHMFVQFSGFELVSKREMKLKNVHFLQSLLDIAIRYPNNLHTGWRVILANAIRLETLAPMRGKGPLSNKSIFQSNVDLIFEGAGLNMLAKVSKIYPLVAILDQNSLKDYLDSLCEICLDPNNDKELVIGSLQKLTEAVGYTIDKPISVWRENWPTVSYKLTQMIEKFTGDDNSEIQQIVLDTLRQLTKKLLGKYRKNSEEENIRHIIFAPFMTLSDIVTDTITTNFISVSLLSIVQQDQDILKEGWIPMFEVFSRLCKDPENSSSHQYGVLCLEMFLQGGLSQNLRFIMDKPDVLLSLTLQIMKSLDKNSSSQALAVFSKVFNSFCQLFDLKVEEDESTPLISETELQKLKTSVEGKITKDIFFQEMVIPAIYTLFDFNRLKIDVVRNSFEFGFKMLTKISTFLDEDSWKIVFNKVIGPYVSNSIQVLKEHQDSQSNTSTEICSFIFKLLEETLDNSMRICKSAGVNIMSLYLKFINKVLSRGTNKVVILLFTILEQCSSAEDSTVDLHSLLTLLLSQAAEIAPHELLSNNAQLHLAEEGRDPYNSLTDSVELDISSNDIATKVIYQMQCFPFLKELYQKGAQHFDDDMVQRLIECIDTGYTISQSFNRRIATRFILRESNYFNEAMIPSLHKLEKLSATSLLWIASYHDSIKRSDDTFELLIKKICALLDNYLSAVSEYLEIIGGSKIKNEVLRNDYLDQLNHIIDNHSQIFSETLQPIIETMSINDLSESGKKVAKVSLPTILKFASYLNCGTSIERKEKEAGIFLSRQANFSKALDRFVQGLVSTIVIN